MEPEEVEPNHVSYNKKWQEDIRDTSEYPFPPMAPLQILQKKKLAPTNFKYFVPKKMGA